MTQNQIAYWNYVESKRNHRAVEKETNRSNLARETETNRSNRAHEYQVFQQRMQDRDLKRIDQNEVERSHRQNEWRDYWALQETKRHNRAVEEVNLISTAAQELTAHTSARAQQEIARSNQVKERQTQQQITSEANLNQARVYQGYASNELTAAYQYGSLTESKRANLASESLRSQQINVEEFRNRELTRHNLAAERETTRHNQASESVQETGNVLNALELFLKFKRDKRETQKQNLQDLLSIGSNLAAIGGSL